MSQAVFQGIFQDSLPWSVLIEYTEFAIIPIRTGSILFPGSKTNLQITRRNFHLHV